ncbi:hypothetical protein LCGC14_0401840 [marine sediment metagenome]|uniref:Uncharacterized protein n=1 Tax=marine sediment metagenome TaxID=412755 RepID=A0A0F9VIP2_9ZZZZ
MRTEERKLCEKLFHVKVIRFSGSYRVAVFDFSYNQTLEGTSMSQGSRRSKYINDLPFASRDEAQKLANAYASSASYETKSFRHWKHKNFQI